MVNSGGLFKRNSGSGPLNTGKLINAHYIEIEYLLGRIEEAGTHYQTLGIERGCASEEIINAYQQSVSILHPSYHKVRSSVPDEMLARVDQAFNKLSNAFSELTDAAKRDAYDKSLKPRSKTAAAARKRKPHLARAADTNPLVEVNSGHKRATSDAVEINPAPELRPAFTRAATAEETVDRRRCERFKLSVPIMIAGYGADGKKWQEITKTIDVSRMGVGVRMRKRLTHGAVVHVTLPLPTKLRSHGFSEAGYNMYAIVRRVEPLTDGFRISGLEFIGATPPADYLHKPWATFRTQKWVGPDRRREPRENRAEPVVVEYLDESMNRISREGAVTEDVSASGARVCVKSAPSEFEFVRITSPNQGFNGVALVRNRWSGSDGFERLCLQFVDQKWPV